MRFALNGERLQEGNASQMNSRRVRIGRVRHQHRDTAARRPWSAPARRRAWRRLARRRSTSRTVTDPCARTLI